LTDNDEEIADVDVTVNGAKDVAGNDQVQKVEADAFDIDTKNPTPSVTVSVDPIYEGALTQNVTVTYDEPMNTTTNPVITFTSTHFISDSDGAWTGNTVWTENFTHVGTQETIASEAASIAAGSGPTDLVGNPENAGVSPVFVLDTEKPTITSIQADPLLTPVGGYINISCDVADTIGVDTVNVIISGPSGFTTVNTSMSPNGGDTYYYYENYSIPGDYNYSIWTDDTPGNSNESAMYQFEIVVRYQIRGMFVGWNFVSMPFNQSINKTNLFVIWSGTEYNWTEATNLSGAKIIDSHIYGWNGAIYEGIDILEAAHGYWIYAYKVCELWATNISYRPIDGYIANLSVGWSAIGAPVNYNVSKSKLLVYWGGTEYNWTEASNATNMIVDSHIYYYDNVSGYQQTDELITGESHWVYAYKECILKWDTA